MKFNKFLPLSLTVLFLLFPSFLTAKEETQKLSGSIVKGIVASQNNMATIFYNACKQDCQFLPNAFLFSIDFLIFFTQDNSSVEVGIKKIIGKLIDISCIS